MAIRPIIITGEPVLHSRAAEVQAFDKELQILVRDMFETMDEAPGVGLAATQVGVGLRIFVYDYPDDEDVQRRGVIINPVLEVGPIEDSEADWETELEGCLSVPGERFPIKRAEWANISGVDLAQNPVSIKATGWFARIFQHEFDHLEGQLYVNKLSEPHFTDALKIVAERGWGVPGKSWLPGVDNLED